MAPTLLPTVQSAFARVLLTLTWPGIQTALVERQDPDGLWRAVRSMRGDDYQVCLNSCAFFDHEAPNDVAVNYRASSPQGSGALNANIFFEAGIANWTGGNGATLASSGTQRHEGALALRLTPNGATANPNAQGEEQPVVVGTTYGATAWLWSTNIFATWGVGIAWYTAGHAFISTSMTSVTVAAATWTNITGSYVAPATAAFGRAVIQATGTPAAANVLYVDEAMGPIDPAALTVTGGPVTVPSNGRVWLKDPGRPASNRQVRIAEVGSRVLGARRGVFRPIGDDMPIVVSDVRQSDTGTAFALITDGTWADLTAYRTLFAPGSSLLLQYPSGYGGESLWISPDTVPIDPTGRKVTSLRRKLTVPFDQIDRPSGATNGAVGITCADVPLTYATCTLLTAAKATCTALATSVV